MRIYVIASLFFLTGIYTSQAQDRRASDQRMIQELARAEDYLHADANSSLLVTSGLLRKLDRQGQINTPFGIRVQLTRAAALVENSRYARAIQVLQRLELLSREKKLWDTNVRTHLLLALAYENTDFKGQTRKQLDLAKTGIDRYKLPAIYPWYAIRMASWQRVYNRSDSALFFVRQALRTAPKYGLTYEEADGYFLLSILHAGPYKEQLQHLRNAYRLYQKAGDWETCGFMLQNIAGIYLKARNFPLALRYCHSARVVGNRLLLVGREQEGTQLLARVYEDRGKIYRQLGRLELALADLKQSYTLLLSGMELKERNNIREIDTRYQIQLAQQKIEEQQFALRVKNDQLHFFLIIAVLVIAIAVGLFIAYRKQRQAKRLLTQQNKTIQQQADQLKTLDATKSRFFANVSHELRTPLTLLLGPVDRLLTGNHLTDQQASLLQLIQRNGRQLEQLVTDILDLGKLEGGKLERIEQPTPVVAFFRNHLAQFASLAESRRLRYVINIYVEEDVMAKLDQPKCRQLLNNLLSNAFKFTPADGMITVTLSLVERQLHLTVTNTGAGIHPNDLPHLFDRYFQTSRPDKPAEGGTGIGLALCQEYVHLFGGKIGVESTPGEGVVFRIVFPVAMSTTVAGEQHRELPTSALSIALTDDANWAPRPLITNGRAGTLSANKPTILVVEDNFDLRTYIQLVLSDQYQVITADNGQQALDRLRTNPNVLPPVSLILTDLMMPVMDGHQLLVALKADDATRHIPVVMLTARVDVQDRLRALRIGVDDYLLKPFDEQELLKRVDNLLTNQLARQQAVVDEELRIDPAKPVLSLADQQWLKTFEHYVQQRLADPLLNIPDVAHDFAMSESTLLRQLKRLTGLSPFQYVQAVRLEEARRLLEIRADYSVAQVATKVGYTAVRAFERRFRARFGKLPSKDLEA